MTDAPDLPDLPDFLDRRKNNMTALAVVESVVLPLPALVDRAAHALTNARSSAEILEAQEMASLAYDAAKRAARLGKAKKAHDDLIAAAYRVQADALEIDARAKRRLADEYDAAQERGEVRADRARTASSPEAVGVADIGLTHKDIHEAREIRDAEEAEPGIIRRALDKMVESGQEPTRAEVRRVAKSKSKRKRTRGRRFDHEAHAESPHDRDLRMLLGVWEAACESARAAFLEAINQ